MYAHACEHVHASAWWRDEKQRDHESSSSISVIPEVSEVTPYFQVETSPPWLTAAVTGLPKLAPVGPDFKYSILLINHITFFSPKSPKWRWISFTLGFNLS